MRLDIFVLFDINITIADLRHILSFSVLIHFDEYWICFCEWDELMLIYI